LSDQAHRDDIAKRIREVAEKFGGITAFAEKLGLPQPQLSQYTTGRRLPGNKFRERLRSAGVDDFYVMYGTKEEIDKKFAVNVMDTLRNAHPEKVQMLDVIEKHGITSAEQLEWILEARRMILNEPKPEYKAKGKKK